MLKVVDVDWYKGYTLELGFSDKTTGKVDLTEIFSAPPFSLIKDFKRFSLTSNGSLDWSGCVLSASKLKELTKITGNIESLPLSINDIEAVIKQASWESMQEGRPDILQAAIRSYVEYFGHQNVIKKAGIKSRTSAYRSLKPETTPNYGTLVQLGHAVIEIAKDRFNIARHAGQ